MSEGIFDRLRYVTACFVFVVTAICLTPSKVEAGLLYLLNDDATGNRIYGFDVNEANGVLTPLAGFPVNAQTGSSATVSERMAVDRLNNRLFVINDGSNTLSVFSINPATGALTPMPYSPISLGDAVWNTVAVHPTGSPVVVGSTTSAHSFTVSAAAAAPAAGSPFAIGTATGFSSRFSLNGAFYYVGGNSGTTIAGFSVNPFSGVLTALAGSPFNTGGTNPIAHAIDGAGRLFTVDLANNIRIFTSPAGILSPVTNNPFASGLTGRRHGLIHPNGFYIVAGNTGNNVGVYQITGSSSGTTVAPIANSPFATGGTTANCIDLNRSGQLLFVGNRASRNVTVFSIITTTGQLTNLGTQPADTLGTAGAINGIAYISASRPRADFDEDGATDMSVFRPSEGNWYINRSTSGVQVTNWGLAGDIPTPGDFDGDEKADIALFRPSTGTWWILRSSDFGFSSANFGLSGDIPVAADYSGDFRADIAVFRPSTNVWYILHSGGGLTVSAWGAPGDLPVPGDYAGDNRTDIAIYRPLTGAWWILVTGGGLLNATLGVATDKPVPADYDGDENTDIAVYRPSNGIWYIRRSSNLSFSFIVFGNSTDIPVPGDYDGDGRDDPAIYRNGAWWLNRSSAGVGTFNFGTSTDIPIPSEYIP